MQKRQQVAFVTMHSEGTLFTVDILQQIAKREPKLDGMTLEGYHLLKNAQFNEVITHAWEKALKAWSEYMRDSQVHPERHLALTREWVRKLLSQLNYGHVQIADAIQTPQRTYTISHHWYHIPIHISEHEGENTLDKVVKSSSDMRRSSPYGMVQELLNNVDGYLWGIVSNGKQLRLLRKNVSITRQAYIEFDLETMMNGEVYADFVLFWLLCHQSRLEGEKIEDCWLEKWLRLSHENGVRALDKLRDGVKQAIETLGTGFLRHPMNRVLQDKVRNGFLDTQDYYRHVLRLVYRFIIIFVAEDRQMIFHPQASDTAKERYREYYSTARLRKLAEKRIGTLHSDLYQSLSLVIRLLGSDDGYLQLGLFALNGFLFSDAAIPDLANCQLANQDLLEAMRALAFINENNIRFPVDYQHLGSEELGSVYESLLELVPVITIGKDTTVGESTFVLQNITGNERKTTGSYYTPTSLIDCLLDSALEPILEEACKKADPEQAILDLKVCDPACGSGHFLVAAAYRIAKRLASIRSGEIEPPAEVWRGALRDVIGHCIYGVDINPMTVELCKVSLWMEAIDPDKPLSFLDSHILEGNSLLGATPALLAKSIPDSAFEAIEGDDKKICSEYRKKNKEQRTKQPFSFFDPTDKPRKSLGNLATSMMKMDAISDDTVQDYQHKQEDYEQFVRSHDYLSRQLVADTWCAAFVWKKNDAFPYPITHEIFRKIELNLDEIALWMKEEVIRLRKQYKFFHWHLEFPNVFRIPTRDEKPENEQTGLCGGFDVVLGNPPWERIKLQEKEWFAKRRPDITNAAKADQRRQMIADLRGNDPKKRDLDLYNEFLAERRKTEGESQIVRFSGRYPLCGRGDINTYAIFAEAMRLILETKGRVGCIIPSGIAIDDTNKLFFQNIVDTQALISLYDFDNAVGLFRGVDSRQKFCLLTVASPYSQVAKESSFVFFAHSIKDLDKRELRFTLSANDIALLNPNSRTCPIFRNHREALLTKSIYQRVPVLIKKNPSLENPWNIKLSRMFDMTNDAAFFRTRKTLEAEGSWQAGNVFEIEDQRWMPVFEGKMIGMYDHRAANIELHEDNALRQQQPALIALADHIDPTFTATPYLWGPEAEGSRRTPKEWKHAWFLVFKRVTSSTNERTMISCIIPWTTVSYTLYTVTCSVEYQEILICLQANFCSFMGDYIVRQKTSQPSLPIGVIYEAALIPPSTFIKTTPWHYELLNIWISKRVLELTYTAWDLEPFAKDCGYDGPPFIWDEERRFLLRCELDAAYFHLYGIERDDVDYIMETFPIVKRKDEKQHGNYRTKRVILEIYDEMKRAIETGEPYQTKLHPPPADPVIAHPPREEVLA